MGVSYSYGLKSGKGGKGSLDARVPVDRQPKLTPNEFVELQRELLEEVR